MANDNKVNLTVVVNGTPTVVEANENAALASVMERALTQTGNVGQGAQNWKFTDPAGNPLDKNLKVRDVLGFGKVLLSLDAGVAGAF